jgi:pimeloyl-ACP methyl ester carboxylesterase
LKQWFKRIIAFVALLYLAGGFFLYINQKSMLYHPTPQTLALETLLLKHTIVVNPDQEYAIIYFGGNADAIEHHQQAFANFFPDHTTYLMYYPHYGGTQGNLNEQTIYQRAKQLYDTIQTNHTHISTIGRSLGSGVATHLATTRPIHKLALITPYDSIQNIAQALFPIYPMNIVLKDKFDSVSRVKKLTVPTLIVLAEYDQVIPAPFSHALLNAFEAKKPKVKTVANSDHGSITAHLEYYKALQLFFKD